MAILLTLFILIIIGLAVAAPIVFLQQRKNLREQKNFERGLKMVPLLIHLPPPSDDMQGNGRDQRDLTDESISKAQIIYNIIASTLQKGFKAKFYGQRHFAFEIIGQHGFVYFYAAVPVALVDVVKQAVISAYPSARLEEVEEHNIFSPVGKLTSTVGGEMDLKNSFAYPIATYQDLKRDAMVSLLNALSTLDKEDGAGIQLLMRPADPSWRKAASAIASKKRKGKEGKGGAEAVGKGVLQFVQAFAKPPEGGKDGGDKPPKELSAMEQQVLDAIDDKTRSPGYEVMIRLTASSNISSRAQAILSNMVATFSLFDAPGKNGFKYTPAKDMESFVTGFIMRFFPQKKNKNILNAVELSTLFHFPDQQNTPTSQVERQMSKQVDGPRNMPEEGLLLGYNVFRGVKKPIRLSLGDRQRHMYAVGQTGTGKSTFLENLALQDMLNGDGFAFIDPHGDTAEKLLSMVPKERTEDVIYFCPADMEYPMGLNLFEFNDPDQKDFLIQETLNMLYKLYDPQHQGIMGPRYEHLFRMAALTVMADPEGGTFVDIPKLFRDPQYVKQKLKYVSDPNVLDFWNKEMPQSQRSNDFGEVVSWFVSKFGAFLSNEMMRNIIGQTKSAFDLRDVMDNKKILIVNLSKGRTGDLNSKLLGMIFVMRFQAAAMSRANIPESQRVDFALYVDEFQNFSTDSFATIMSEARKYHLNLIVANQFTTQLTDEIRDAVFGNMGTIVSFRVGQNDVEGLAKYFQPAFDADDLLRVPNYNAIVRTLVGGVPTNPFSMAALPPLGNPNQKLGEALKQLSGAKYGKPRGVVEKEVFARLATKEEPKPAFGGSGGGFGSSAGGSFGAAPPQFGGTRPGGFGASPAPPFGAAPSASPAGGFGPASSGFGSAGGPSASSMGRAGAPAAPSGGSFLDDWMAKRQQMPPASISSARFSNGAPMAPAAPAPTMAAAPSLYAGTAPAGPLASPAAPAPAARQLASPDLSPLPAPQEDDLPKIQLKHEHTLDTKSEEPAEPSAADGSQTETADESDANGPHVVKRHLMMSAHEEAEVPGSTEDSDAVDEDAYLESDIHAADTDEKPAPPAPKTPKQHGGGERTIKPPADTEGSAPAVPELVEAGQAAETSPEGASAGLQHGKPLAPLSDGQEALAPLKTLEIPADPPVLTELPQPGQGGIDAPLNTPEKPADKSGKAPANGMELPQVRPAFDGEPDDTILIDEDGNFKSRSDAE